MMDLNLKVLSTCTQWTRQVMVDVPVPVDQPFEQLVHSTRDVHVPVPRAFFFLQRVQAPE